MIIGTSPCTSLWYEREREREREIGRERVVGLERGWEELQNEW